MKVVVVGAGGFVGQRIGARLAGMAAPSEILLVDRMEIAPASDRRIQCLTGDFADPAVRARIVGGADAVIHLAAILGGAAEANYQLARKVNLDATLDLAEALSATNPKARFVFASTIAVFAKPLPDPVTDSTPTGPMLVYGAQKLMIETALSNFTAKGWLDAISLRPSGVMARDGADAGLKSAFMSRLFWAVRRGLDITLPVAPDNRTWLTSIGNVADNFVHAALTADLGRNRALTLPALSLTFGELVDALKKRFPDNASRISFSPDPDLVALFGQYPRLETRTADALGFTRDRDAEDLVANAF